jgi:hypothetical protein
MLHPSTLDAHGCYREHEAPHGFTIRRRVFAVNLLQKQREENLDTTTDCTTVQATEGAVQPPEPRQIELDARRRALHDDRRFNEENGF